MQITRTKKEVVGVLKLKNLGEYHDWYVQNDALLLAGVFENFRNIYLKTYVLDPAKFTASPRLAYQAA